MKHSTSNILKKFDKRLCIKATIEFKDPLGQCWEIITTKNHLELFHPFIISHFGERLSSIGDKDNIVYMNKLNFTREVISIYEPRNVPTDTLGNNWCGYDLLVGRKKKSLVKWRIVNHFNGRVELSITVWPHTISGYNKITKFFVFNFYIKPQIRKYLKSVTQGFKYYIETKEIVEKEQFGKHKWFSKTK